MEVSYDGGSTTAIGYGEPGPIGVLLAHGAGVGQDHEWMTTMAAALAGQGLYTLTFNYRYTEAGRKSPDRLPVLLEVHRAAADALAAECDRVVLAGKSMGGRVGSHLVGDEGWPAAGLVYYGYPLVPPGKDPRPIDHLERIEVPQLFVSGTRDRLGPLDAIEAAAAAVPDGQVIIVDGGDHSLRVPKAMEKTMGEVLEEVAAQTADWVGSQLADS